MNDEQFVLSSIRQAGRQLCAQEKSRTVLAWCVMESHSNYCSTILSIMLTGAFGPSKQPQVSNGCWKVVTPQLEHSAQVRVSQLLRVATKVECHWEFLTRCYGILVQPPVKMVLERFGTLCQETCLQATSCSVCPCRAFRRPHFRAWSVALRVCRVTLSTDRKACYVQ